MSFCIGNTHCVWQVTSVYSPHERVKTRRMALHFVWLCPAKFVSCNKVANRASLVIDYIWQSQKNLCCLGQ